MNALHLYSYIKTLPCEVVSVDWRAPLSEVRPLLGTKTLQGNLDPAALLATKDVIKQEAERVLRAGLGGAHIFNLGHGIMKQTDPEHLAYLVETVQRFDRGLTKAES